MYLQSENGTPFYIRIGEKVISSSAEGYLIVPKLRDSTYNFSVGRSGKQNELQFTVTINKNDRGFLIKNDNELFYLFDLQTLNIHKPVPASASSGVQTTSRTDSFTKLLAKAADDSTLLTQAIIVEQPKKALAPPTTVVVDPTPATSISSNGANETATASGEEATRSTEASTAATEVITTVTEESKSVKQDTVRPIASVPAAQVEVQTKDTVTTAAASYSESKETSPLVEQRSVEEEVYVRSVVTRQSESSTGEGFGLVFLDKYSDSVDTIQILIPNPSYVFGDSTKEPPKKEFLEITSRSESLAKSSGKGKVKEKKAAPVEKTGCSSAANDDDFFKLRRDMAAKKTDDDMIVQARKYFRSKCFRTEQIKYLSNLLLSDAGKYNFFDAAYNHVSDQQKFQTLETELKDDYYKNRFKALVAK
ncbi:MAG TPA: DUF4476 domain-containing protein [Chitinophagaceae bacterium]|nr:DUF4476 domain-containing protein [Chitinophagaceae bacterium]